MDRVESLEMAIHNTEIKDKEGMVNLNQQHILYLEGGPADLPISLKVFWKAKFQRLCQYTVLQRDY